MDKKCQKNADTSEENTLEVNATVLRGKDTVTRSQLHIKILVLKTLAGRFEGAVYVKFITWY